MLLELFFAINVSLAMLYGNLCFRRHSKKPQSLSFSKAPPNDTEDLGFGSFSPTNDNHLPKQHFEEQRVAFSIFEL